MNIQDINAGCQAMVQEAATINIQNKAIDNIKLQGQQVIQMITTSSVPPISDPAKGNLINILA